MYALETLIQVPNERVTDLRDALASDYLPLLRLRPGFRTALVLSDPDDHGILHVVQVWECRSAAETFARTGALGMFVRRLDETLPLASVQSHGYGAPSEPGERLAQ